MSKLSGDTSPDPDPSGGLAKLPQVDRLIRALDPSLPHATLTAAAREVIASAKKAHASGDPIPDVSELVQRASALISDRNRARLTRVINATGVLLHTNLGRAPLSRSAIKAVSEIASGYSNLEFDVSSGKRGSRYDHAGELLRAVTGAEAVLTVNNNAGAVLLALAAVARGREVIVSRGELIEIGGEFRIPEILAESGAILKEVGTTNRTHLRDYEKAISQATGAILKVHPSNYRVVGFTAAVKEAELSDLAKRSNIAFVHDLGSGLIERRGEAWLDAEPSVIEAVRMADIVTFSGDKLLGGPQCGIIAGRREFIDKIRSFPLLRALRIDKMSLAALEATLLDHLRGELDAIPFWRMATMHPSEIEVRGQAVLDGISAQDSAAGTLYKMALADSASATGGGSAPGSAIPTVVIEVSSATRSAEEIRGALLLNDPPVVARIEHDRVLIDLRTVDPSDDEKIREVLVGLK